jgi:cAMP phosphodiesterase
MRPTSFLVDGRVAIDTGALTSELTLAEQARVSHIFVAHSHFDHVATLPFLLDNVFETAEEPVTVLGPPDTIRCLKEHLFNGLLWPDFTKISNGKTVLLALRPLAAGETVAAGDLRITPFPMDHTVECHGYIVEDSGGAVAICGDTCSTDGLAAVLPGIENLKAVFIEASFPRAATDTAVLSKHLSTESFGREAACIPSSVPILVTHLKPCFTDIIREEIAALGMQNVSLLEQDKEYEF